VLLCPFRSQRKKLGNLCPFCAERVSSLNVHLNNPTHFCHLVQDRQKKIALGQKDIPRNIVLLDEAEFGYMNEITDAGDRPACAITESLNDDDSDSDGRKPPARPHPNVNSHNHNESHLKQTVSPFTPNEEEPVSSQEQLDQSSMHNLHNETSVLNVLTSYFKHDDLSSVDLASYQSSASEIDVEEYHRPLDQSNILCSDKNQEIETQQEDNNRDDQEYKNPGDQAVPEAQKLTTTASFLNVPVINSDAFVSLVNSTKNQAFHFSRTNKHLFVCMIYLRRQKLPCIL
jgi:hypothetical protein